METNVNKELYAKFMEAYKTAESRYGFSSPIFIRMLNDHGALETARRLCNTAVFQKGFERIVQLGGLELTVEYIILKEEYRKYFTASQLENAQAKIDYAVQLYGTR